MIHGRFQPFHLEHLRYFRLAWESSEKVIVGVTNPDTSTIVADELSDHRHLAQENPFTFIERCIMIQESLREEGYPMERIYIVPFPIHHPDRWLHYVPPGTAMFVVVYSPWERRKAKKFQEAGLQVVVEDSFNKSISGQQIRTLLAEGRQWEHLVPPAVARFLHNREQGPANWR
jgi:nicotinamide-nucleotide adenylyltransferase